MPKTSSTKNERAGDDASLKRLGGGRWQTRDERFSIEPQSGTWVVIDAEQTDDLGLPLVRGPFPSLTAAKDAIATARSSEPATSPLAERLEHGHGRSPTRDAAPKRDRPSSRADRVAGAGDHETERATERDQPRRGSRAKVAAEPTEPTWLAELKPAERGRARRLIERLEDAGVGDAEGIVRRDVVGGVPAVAAAAIARQLEALGSDASPGAVAALLAEGRDDALDVRWRIVDGSGRPILVEPPGRQRRR